MLLVLTDLFLLFRDFHVFIPFYFLFYDFFFLYSSIFFDIIFLIYITVSKILQKSESMEAVNDHEKILKDLVEAAMGAAEISGQASATTSSPLSAVTAVLGASGITGMVTEAAAGVITDTVSKN